MESRIENAVEKKGRGYNCAQAVACTYCDLVGIDEKTIFRVTEGFGIGMGNMEGVCGAISGACAILGFLNSTANLEHPDSNGATLKLSRIIMEKFKEQNTSLVCKELKGINSGKILRSCPDCVADASKFLEEILADKGIM